MAENLVDKLASDGYHMVVRNASNAVSKGSLMLLNGGQSLTHGFHGLFHGLNQLGAQVGVGAQAGMAGGAAAMGGLGGIVAVGAVGVMSGALAQMDYRHELNKIKEVYRNEIAAQLGKPAKSVKADDLFVLAKGDESRGIKPNGVLQEELKKQKRDRTLGVFLSAAATVTSFVAVHGLLDIAIKGAAEAITTSIGLPGAGTAIATGLHIAAGVSIYNMVKKPLHWVGAKILKLDNETSHDRIANIQKDLDKGRGITQEQVLEVFAGANKQLDEFITNEYGKEFSELSQHERQQVVQDINKTVALARMTDDINNGKYNVGELAFAVEGNASGYMPDLQERPKSWLNNMASKLRGMFNYKNPEIPAAETTTSEVSAAQAATSANVAKADAPEAAPSAWHPANDHAVSGKQSHTERVAAGRKKESSLGHVERLEQSRSDNPIGTQLA